MSEELDLLISLETGVSGPASGGVPGNRSLFQRYIFWRLDGNPDPLKDEGSLRAFTKWTEEMDLVRRILNPNKEKISKIHVNPCDLPVGLDAEQVVRRKQ